MSRGGGRLVNFLNSIGLTKVDDDESTKFFQDGGRRIELVKDDVGSLKKCHRCAFLSLLCVYACVYVRGSELCDE